MIETETHVSSEHHPTRSVFRKPSLPSLPARDNSSHSPSESLFEKPWAERSPTSSRRRSSQGQIQLPPPSFTSPRMSALERENPVRDINHILSNGYPGEAPRNAIRDAVKDAGSTSGTLMNAGQKAAVIPSSGIAKARDVDLSEGSSRTELSGPGIVQNHNRKQSPFDSPIPEGKDKLVKLLPEKIQELTIAPESLILRPLALDPRTSLPSSVSAHADLGRLDTSKHTSYRLGSPRSRNSGLSIDTGLTSMEALEPSIHAPDPTHVASITHALRPPLSARAMSTPTTMRRRSQSPRRHSILQHTEKGEGKVRDSSANLRVEAQRGVRSPTTDATLPSPMPSSLPLPPLSIPTYLQLELSSHRPSQLYIHRSVTSDFPYESSRVKIERLLNFLLLPPQLEGVLWFGSLACFDAWLYTFTILPLRLLKSFYILSQSWATNLISEAQYVSTFIYKGTGRMWRRRRTRGFSESKAARTELANTDPTSLRDRPRHHRNHRRTKSVPSMLLPDDKADILKGALIICTCVILLRLDASRMYHWVRGQAAIKLYVIYNVLEVCDRLFSAIGQDVLECLFSREALERKPDGHSKVLRPFWLFMLALIYTVIHSTSLFYQVITLNVAVNSYSNALITLLISNQFVEIKSTVFKKFEKDNLFQLTCADVVERFQLWLMLTIIASRNIVETGGLSVGLEALSSAFSKTGTPATTNTSTPFTAPRTASSILPRSFTLVPAMLSSLTAYAPAVENVLGPFLVVLGSEMLVDWIKHAYIGKFNNTRPAIYGRFLDVLAKDYYTNAFAEQNLTKRLGLPVIPLSCLFIRASVQTYHMFTAAWVPAPIASSSTSLASIHQQYTASRASMPTSTVTTLSDKFDDLIRQIPAVISSSRVVTNFTTILTFLLIFLVLVACKLVLGMILLSFSRARYRSMKEREKDAIYHVQGGKRVGGWGVVEVDDDKRRWIYEDDPAGLRAGREREEKEKVKRDRGVSDGLEKVKRYEMVAKRIW